MRLGFYLIAQLLGTVIFAQNEINTLPVEGNIGIGTDSATCKLDVRGQTKLEGQVVIAGDLIVLDSAVFNNRLIAQDQLKVQGFAEFKNNFKVDLNTQLNGDVNLPQIELVLMDTAINILLLDQNGNVKKTTLTEVLNEIYGPNLCPSGDILNPVWANGLNKIFVSCPQVNVGVGIENPIHKLHVGGTTYAHKFLAGNVDAITNALISVFAVNETQNLLQLGVKIGVSAQEIRFIVSNDGNVQIFNSGNDHSITIHNGSGHAIVVHAQNGSKILQLENNGLLSTREVKVNTNTWPDYVSVMTIIT